MRAKLDASAPILVGTGATYYGYTDRSPYTVIEVVSERELVVQADNAKRIDANGLSECQDYEYSPNPQGEVLTITKRRTGRWIVKGESTTQGRAFSVGVRRKYHDFSF